MHIQLFFLSSSCHSLADQSLAYEKNSAPNGPSPKEKMFLTRHDYEWRTCCASVRLMACVALKRTSVSFAWVSLQGLFWTMSRGSCHILKTQTHPICNYLGKIKNRPEAWCGRMKRTFRKPFASLGRQVFQIWKIYLILMRECCTCRMSFC